MKTNTNFTKTAILLITIITSIACNKPASTPGPAGADGKTGAQGIAGAQGAKGDKGDPGSANVFYSDWTKLDPSPNKKIIAPKITNEIYDKGLVLVYWKQNSRIHNVPFVQGQTNLLYDLFVGYIQFYGSASDFFYDYSSNFLRYIIIPPGTKIGAGRKAALQSMRYEEIKALYNIKD